MRRPSDVVTFAWAMRRPSEAASYRPIFREIVRRLSTNRPAWCHLDALPPVRDRLVVEHDIRLWQEPVEAVSDAD
jgi:hypothetical protein